MILTVVVIAAIMIIAVTQVYTAWHIATSKVSAQMDCQINHINYISLTEDKDGNGDCAFPLVTGNVTMCALPEDIHCSGLIQDFPIIRAIIEMNAR
jgi:hypothetical protein